MEIPYSIDQFSKDIESVKPRAFDIYVLPPFMAFYAWKSKGMPKIARRMLFTAAVYMFYRSYSSYKELVTTIIPGTQSGGAQ
jgi:hypothetical protein